MPIYLQGFRHYEPSTQLCHLVHSHSSTNSHKVMNNENLLESKTYVEASTNPMWVEAMTKELHALEYNQI